MFSVECSRLRFLIVDDNNHMRRIIRALLHGFGVREAYEAEDGAAGLEAFTSYSPDIVITDWAMPIFDGIELTRMIRQPETSSNPYVPIIMVTGHAERKRVAEARDAGVTEFLVKPISAKGLYQRIVSVVMAPAPSSRPRPTSVPAAVGRRTPTTVASSAAARASPRRSIPSASAKG